MQPKLNSQILGVCLAASAMMLTLLLLLLYSPRPGLRAPLAAYADASGIAGRSPALAQEDEGEEEETPIPPEQIEKYIAVYKAMQKNHDLSVEQAAATQGLTVEAFRDIESHIERDDLIRERVRQALRGTPVPEGATSGTPQRTPAK